MLSIIRGGKRLKSAKERICQECKTEPIEIGILCDRCRINLTREGLAKSALRHESTKGR